MHEPAVVLRVLDIVSPVKCVAPNYDFNFKMPEVGQLITKSRYGNYYPWSLDITKGPAKCLELFNVSVFARHVFTQDIENFFSEGQPGRWGFRVHSLAWHPSLPEPAKKSRSRSSITLQGALGSLSLKLLKCRSI